MLTFCLNPNMTDDERRSAIFAGRILFYAASESSRALTGYCRDLVLDAFQGMDPEHAQESLDVADFIARVGPLKTQFTNSPRTKELLANWLVEMGVDPEETYFDVPRLRVVPHSDYLSAGVSYAYKAHRDIWYSSPTSQLNWWLPVYDVVPERAMAFYPSYFERPLNNSSEAFDYGEWVSVGRATATSQTKVDTRSHPLPMQAIDAEEFLFGAAPGDALVFSASHLHATVPNTSGSTRFSIDFRTLNRTDIEASRGGPNVDSRATGSTLNDFLRVADLAPYPAEA